MPPYSRRPSVLEPARPCASLVELVRSRHYLVRVDDVCKLVVARRSCERFETRVEIEGCFDQLAAALAHLERKDYKLLVDVRQDPARNDPEFESTIRTHRQKLLCGFSCNAALAATAVGRLQIQRYAQSDRREVFATDQPSEAFRHLGVDTHEL